MPRRSTGRFAPGRRKLTDEQVWDVRRLNVGTAELAARFGVHQSNIQAVRFGRMMTHVPNPTPAQLTVEQLIYLLSQHPPKDLIDMETLCIEVRQGFAQDNEPQEES